jgi:bifunctional dethiobiotin synthetase / adenosylmethionine---8-amino-7-oxononanoate aminotransferase
MTVVSDSAVWFDYPKVKMTRGKWVVDMPQDMEAGLSEEHGSLSEIFDRTQDSASSKLYGQYTKYIENALQKQSGRSFGALIMEPVILGAGGMIFASVIMHSSSS